MSKMKPNSGERKRRGKWWKQVGNSLTVGKKKKSDEGGGQEGEEVATGERTRKELW